MPAVPAQPAAPQPADAQPTSSRPAPERPQIYLISPPVIDPASFPDRLAAVLDAAPVACLRLALAGADPEALGRAADAARAVAHERDVAVVIDRHLALAQRHGLDGVHLTDGARSVRAARRELGAEAIVGAFCGTSRHEGMSAGEAGADYVAFGPVSAGPVSAGLVSGAPGTGAPAVGALGMGEVAPRELFAWWAEMIEVPVVAEGGLDPATIRALAPVADFLALGEELWRQADPAAALRSLSAILDE